MASKDAMFTEVSRKQVWTAIFELAYVPLTDCKLAECDWIVMCNLWL